MLFGLRSIRISPSSRTELSSSSFSLVAFSHLYSAISLALNSDSPPLNPPKPLTQPQLKTLVLSHYRHGRFSNLLQNVVASPSFLLTAAQNLASTRPHELTFDSVSAHFDLHQLGRELARNEFEPVSCCVRLPPSRKNGESLVLPNLKLKVVIEALRMVLEIVYDGGFATFVYGGRPGLGRHTAVRYLKNSVENPNWWFTLVFNRAYFDSRHVGRLCSIIGERIDDGLLIGLVKKLFECGVLRIELGGGYLGKGLPQECGLCAILINIYLNGFDKKIQKIRLRINEANPKVDDVSDAVIYKPVKIYAVRYLDEMFLITSGSKVLAMDLLNWVVKYLENELDLKVDRLKTAIHSAVSEKIDFLGMELQAVPPSVLRPPLSEKAIRARKKYLRQKQVRAAELKNARERNRRKLGLKIFSHVFKKLKQSNGFKFEYQIEDEVREIFRSWADEVVQEFFDSLEERWNWHRQLTAGDFLSLKRIRDQLPQELIDAYDKFQEEVDKHLNPMKLKKAIEEEERKAREEEERKYSERTVEDLTKLCMKVAAPIELIRKAVRLVGFTNDMGRPRPISLLIALEDADIIKWYAGIGRRWLEYFCCCRNFQMVKTTVTYHLRFSCLLTLAEKHESTKSETIRHFSKDLKVLDLNGNEEMYFPSEREVKSMGDGYFSDPKPVDGALTLALIRLAYDEPSYTCAAHFCDRKDTITYRVWLLQTRLNIDPMDQKKWVPGMSTIHESFDRKCLPLCATHSSDLYLGRMSLQDIDCTSFIDVDYSNLDIDERHRKALRYPDFHCVIKHHEDSILNCISFFHSNILSSRDGLLRFVRRSSTFRIPFLLHSHHLNSSSFCSLSSSCLHFCRDLQSLKVIHGHLIVSSQIQYNPIASELVNLYAKFGDFGSSLTVMGSFQEPSPKVWNLVMKSALDLGNFEMGISIFRQMKELGIQHDSFTLPVVNQLYMMLGCGVRCAKMTHCVGIRMGFSSDLYFCNTLMECYVKCDCISVAHKLFDEMPLRDDVSWTSLISGYVNEEKLMQSFELFTEMRRQLEPNFVTVITMLRACSCWNANSGKQFHGYLLKQGFLVDSSVRNSLLQIYTNKGAMEDVENLFSELGAVDVVAWNILISFYLSIGTMEVLVGKFQDMLREVAPSVETLTLIASALSKSGSFCQGQELHCFATKKGLGDRILLTCLMDLYAKFGRLDESVRLFREVPCPTTVTGSTLMRGFIEQGQYDDAIRLFRKLQSVGVELTANIMENLLDVCVDTGALHLGKETHGSFFRNSSSNAAETNSVLETAILNMYIRCGSISSARHCFNMIVDKDIVVWTSMIEGLGTFGLGLEALEHFSQMLKEGIEPNPITFLSVLSACSHAGLTHEGCKLLFEMKWRFGFNPDLNHYTCIVDLLGRAGKLKEALVMILKMALCPDSRIWGALLSASRVYMDRKVGEYALKRLVELEPDNVGYQIVFSNMRASAEQWDEVEELRSTVAWAHSNKAPGWSCIEANGEIQGFVSGDRAHVGAGIIYELLGFLNRHMKDPDMYAVKLN